jgi:hypothetical protein
MCRGHCLSPSKSCCSVVPGSTPSSVLESALRQVTFTAILPGINTVVEESTKQVQNDDSFATADDFLANAMLKQQQQLDIQAANRHRVSVAALVELCTVPKPKSALQLHLDKAHATFHSSTPAEGGR